MQVFKKCSDKKTYENYPHQETIANALSDMDAKGNFSTIVTVPTGGGKTKIATDFCIKKLSEGTNKVIWLSDTVELLIQIIKKMKDVNLPQDIKYQLLCGTNVYSHLKRQRTDKEKEAGIQKINIAVEALENETDMLFASVDTIVHGSAYERIASWLQDAQEKGKVYFIYDEVHHIGAEQTERFFEKLFGVLDNSPVLQNFALIGLTATVYRFDSPVKSFNRWFKYGYNNGKIVKDDTSYGVGVENFINNRIEVVSIQELINEGLLMKPTIIRVDDFEEGVPKNDNEAMDYLAEKVKRHYKSKKWNKTIIFVDGKPNAKKLYSKLNEYVPCFVYTSDSVADSKDIEDFVETDGRPAKVMIAVDMVSEGFDVKNIETIYLYSKVGSHILIRQRVGRVLRIADNKKKATVYWQNYFDHKKDDVVGLENIRYDANVVEDDLEIQRDIGRWKKGKQLPAGMYLEELPTDIESERLFYKRYEYLHALDRFGLDVVTEGIGYYKLGAEKVYARAIEQKGYKQFHRTIRSDYFSLLIFKDKALSFANYASALGVSEDKLLEDIKINCFYMPVASKEDTRGNVSSKRQAFIVSDGDIKNFYEWVMANDLKMPEYEDVSAYVFGDSNSGEEEDGEPEYGDVSPEKDNITYCAT